MSWIRTEKGKVRKAKQNVFRLVIFEMLTGSLYLSLFLLQALPESWLEWRLKLAVTPIAAVCITLALAFGLLAISTAKGELQKAKDEMQARIEWEKWFWSPKGFYEAFWNEPYPEG